jgi:branched-subunit amino acid aminotransferase/4-amino-4-deoxychorismate lyase
MPTIFLDGRFEDAAAARVSAFDAGLLHGVGLFDTMLGGVREDGSAWALHGAEHLSRLAASARDLGLTDSLRVDALAEAVLETIRRNAAPGRRVRVRATVTGGDLNLLAESRGASADRRSEGGGTFRPTILITAQPATVYPAEMFERGVGVVIADARANPLSPMEGHKTLNYWWRLRELAAAGRRGAAEAIVLQVSNHLCGGCVSNVLVIRGGEAWTPIARGEEHDAAGASAGRGRADERPAADPAAGSDAERAPPAPPASGRGAALPSPCLPGVVRAWALEELARRGITVRRRMLGIGDLLDADEVLLTNSSWGVLPVVKVEREAIGDGVVGALSRDLVGAWADLVGAHEAGSTGGGADQPRAR